jgi:hypothetical protein
VTGLTDSGCFVYGDVSDGAQVDAVATGFNTNAILTDLVQIKSYLSIDNAVTTHDSFFKFWINQISDWCENKIQGKVALQSTNGILTNGNGWYRLDVPSVYLPIYQVGTGSAPALYDIQYLDDFDQETETKVVSISYITSDVSATHDEAIPTIGQPLSLSYTSTIVNDSSTGTIRADLYQGATLIHTGTERAQVVSTAYTETLTASELLAITDTTSLKVRFVVTDNTSGDPISVTALSLTALTQSWTNLLTTNMGQVYHDQNYIYLRDSSTPVGVGNIKLNLKSGYATIPGVFNQIVIEAVIEIFNESRRDNNRFGITSMSSSTPMGISASFERLMEKHIKLLQPYRHL